MERAPPEEQSGRRAQRRRTAQRGQQERQMRKDPEGQKKDKNIMASASVVADPNRRDMHQQSQLHMHRATVVEECMAIGVSTWMCH